MSNISTEQSRQLYYDELHFIPVEKKNPRWGAEVLYFCKGNSQAIFEKTVLEERRRIELGKLDDKAYKSLIDPVEKTAEFFTSDWSANPIFNHLNNIVDSKIEKIPFNLVVKAIDEFSQNNQHKENSRILGRNEMRNYLNEMNAKFGFPQIKESQDPYRYVEDMQAQSEEGKKNGKSTDISSSLLDSIKASIFDNEGLALFNEYIWKDGVEIAIELGMLHYLFNVNKFRDHSSDTLQDIRLANCCVYRYYTSETTGTPVFERLDPGLVRVSNFKKKDLSDIIHWYIEYEITFGDFVRMFGAGLNRTQLREIFEKNKDFHGIEDYDNCNFMTRNMASIRIGYIEFESQDMEVYSEYQVRGNPRYRRVKDDYQPTPFAIKNYNARRDEKNYNVWYKFYYIPSYSYAADMGTTDFDDQAKFIFKFGKVQDQQRYGDDRKYSKTSLFGWVMRNKMSFFDVMNSYMPKINLLWQQYQNDVVNAIPHGMIWVEELLSLALTVVDDKKSDPKDLKTDFIQKLKQTGNGISKMIDPKTGQVIAGGKPFIEVKTGHLNSALERLNLIMVQYQMMTRALGISETSEGVDPRPRVSVSGIQQALEGTNNSTFFIEDAYTRTLIQAGEKLLYYFKDIVDKGKSIRLQEFEDIVGKSNGMALQAIKDIPLHTLGLSVQNSMTDQQKQLVNQLANQMAGAGVIDMDIALFITTIDNLKYSYAILRLKMKERQRQIAEEKRIEFERNMALKNADQQFVMAQIQLENQDKLKMADFMRQWDAKLMQLESMLKKNDQLEIKDKISSNRIDEKIVDKKLEDQTTAA